MRGWAQRSTAVVAILVALRGIELGEGPFVPVIPGSNLGFAPIVIVVLPMWRWDRSVRLRDPAGAWSGPAPTLVLPPGRSRLRPRRA